MDCCESVAYTYVNARLAGISLAPNYTQYYIVPAATSELAPI